MKNYDETKNHDKDHRNSQNQIKAPKSTAENSNPYDSENLDQKTDSDSKDITGKNIEKDLIENDPSQGLKLIWILTRTMRMKATPLKPSSPKRAIP